MSGMKVHAVVLPGSISNFQCAPRDGNYLQKESEVSGFAEYAPERLPSGAKARIDFAGLMHGLKPVPFTESSFSACSEVVP